MAAHTLLSARIKTTVSLLICALLVSCTPSSKHLHALLDAGKTTQLLRAISRDGNVDALNAFDESLLSRSAELGEIEIVRALLAAGANPDPPDRWSPLDWAIRRGDIELLRLLLEAGASTTRRNYLSFVYNSSAGLSPEERHAFTRTFLEFGAENLTLLPAVQSYDRDAVVLLLSAGVDPNRNLRTNGTNILPLDAAIDAISDPQTRESSIEIAETVIAAGGMAAAIDDENYRQILAYGSETLVSAIRSMVTFKDSGEIIPVKPLWESIANDNYDEVIASIRAGADPNGFVAGYLALAVAIYTHKPEATAALIDAGADQSQLQTDITFRRSIAFDP